MKENILENLRYKKIFICDDFAWVILSEYKLYNEFAVGISHICALRHIYAVHIYVRYMRAKIAWNKSVWLTMMPHDK